jgi:hypothetical protein
MRRRLALLLLSLLPQCLGVWVVAQEPAADAARTAALAIVTRAIEAHGGADALMAQPALTIRIKGHTISSSAETPTQPFVSRSTRLLPDKMRQEIRVGRERGEDEPGPADYVVVVNGNSGWMMTGGQVFDLSAVELARLQLELLVMQASTLVPLKAPDVKLRIVTEVDAPHSDVVAVQFPKSPELRLSFDRKSHLLVKTEYYTTDGAGNTIYQENFYDQFKPVGGVKRFFHYAVRRDGEAYAEGEIVEYLPAKTADEKLFTKPKP